MKNVEVTKAIPTYVQIHSFDEIPKGTTLADYEFIIMTERHIGEARNFGQRPTEMGIVLVKDAESLQNWVLYKGTSSVNPVKYQITRVTPVKVTLTATVE